jgi:glycosyltransferase involved in cell wall biosynthesis
MNTRKIIWITWERQIRNHSMTKKLGVPLFEVLSNSGRFERYIFCIKKTFKRLRRERPNVVICQNPSLILCCFILSLRFLYRYKVVIDAHYGGIEAYNGSKIFQHILNLCNRSADLVIATNENHGKMVKRLGGNVFVCPDPLPDLSRFDSQERVVDKKVYFICSFDPDEPFNEVFGAAKMLRSDGFRFFVSGNFKRAQIATEEYPFVQFLGFVPEGEFYQHLFSAQIVVDLTNNENCLVCGAYEALEAGKPLVLSNKKALTEFFDKGTVFTENTAEKIAESVKYAYREELNLKAENKEWVNIAKENIDRKISELNLCLEKL